MTLPTGAWLVLFLCAAVAAATATGKEDGGPAEMIVGGSIPLVDAVLNGDQPHRMIVDTGASDTLVTPRVASSLGLATRPFSGAQRKARLATVAVKDAVVRDLDIMVFDPPQAVPLRLNDGVDYHGILGYTFLRRFLVSIDYPRLRLDLRLIDSVPWTPASDRKRAIPFTLQDSMILVRGTVNGSNTVRFLLDTGCANLVLSPACARRLRLPLTALPGVPGGGKAMLESVAVTQHEVRNIAAVVLIPPQDAGIPRPYDGILGFPFLSRFAVTINYRDALLELRPATAP